MNERTCKFYNGTWHNTHCEAGVCYKDVTPEPDNCTGSMLRLPCITYTKAERLAMTAGQLEHVARKGMCETFQLPTKEELEEQEARWQERWKEVSDSLEKGIVPDGVFVCGPSRIGKCKCDCPKSCEHVWNGAVIEEDEISTATCSRCGMWAINHDMWHEI
jgi:hypothetical protein